MEKNMENYMETGSFYLGCRGYNSKAMVGCAEVAVMGCQRCGFYNVCWVTYSPNFTEFG